MAVSGKSRAPGRFEERPGLGYADFPYKWGEGKTRSPKFKCNNLRDGTKLFGIWRVEQAERDALATELAAEGAAEERTIKYFITKFYPQVSPQLETNTIALDKSTMNFHIFKDEQFCALDYQKLNSDDIMEFLGRMVDRFGKPASSGTKKRVYKFLKWCFQSAVEERRLPFNPIHIAKNKVPKIPDSEVVSFTPTQERILIQAALDSPEWAPIVIFALDTGVRMSELLGLNWDKVDLKTSEVRIHRVMITEGSETSLGPPKTPYSKRTIRLSPTTTRALATLQHINAGQGGPVFTRDGGWNRHTYANAWDTLLKSAGLPAYGFHSTRHTMATRLLRGGAYVTAVSKRLGHANAAFTLKTYTDAIPDDQDQLTTAFETTMANCLKIAPSDVPQIT